MALSHSEEPARELNNTSLDSKESQQRDEEKSKDVDQRNVLKYNEEGVIKSNQQLEKKIEAIQKKEGTIQCDFVETIELHVQFLYLMKLRQVHYTVCFFLNAWQ